MVYRQRQVFQGSLEGGESEMKGKRFEKTVAKAMGGALLGGPAEPDYRRGPIEGEVKSWKDRMGKSEVMKEADKGRDEIVSKEGFTDDAVDYKDRYRPKLRLFDWKVKAFV